MRKVGIATGGKGIGVPVIGLIGIAAAIGFTIYRAGQKSVQ